MSAPRSASLPARRVLVTVGTPCAMSAMGSTETHGALVSGDPNAIAFAACDAGLVAVDTGRGGATDPVFVHADGDRDRGGRPVAREEIEGRWGAGLREHMGIRRLPPIGWPSTC